MKTIKTAYIVLLLLFVVNSNCVCQDNPSPTIQLESADVYILKFRMIAEVAPVKYKVCASGKKLNTNLYRIIIDEIIRASDTSVFKNSELYEVEYALFEEKPKDDSLTGTFWNSDSKKCLIFNRELKLEGNKDVRFYQHACIVGLMRCNNKKRILKEINKFEQQNKKY